MIEYFTEDVPFVYEVPETYNEPGIEMFEIEIEVPEEIEEEVMVNVPIEVEVL